ncbi:MAG: aminotransferase class III-fold pyridoxal phosphate-dependent enzyme [Rhodobacteraceae bacterium]|nr:aminotransferase class III-fold pyridoxal phosphate-dependent enzyme [Paracoccaceae bacterium]
MAKIVHHRDEWVARAREILPAGGLGNFDPGVFIRKGAGLRVWSEDGREFIDLLIGSGPMILGHGHPEVLEAVSEQLPLGMTFFANNSRAVELAEEICRAVACAEQVRFVSSGGEADMFAMRLARAHTGRDLILKFEGGYHGMSAEAQMSLAPTRPANYPDAIADSAGIPDSVRRGILVAPFNDVEFLQKLLDQQGDEIAGVIVEPLQRIIPADARFLRKLRSACDRHGIMLIFDEIVTGFRLAYGGAQEYYGVIPDVCTLGKVIGGGFPLAAIAGRRDIMADFDREQVGAEGFLMQVGTLSGNPVAASAGLKTPEILRRSGTYDQLRASGKHIMSAASAALDGAGHAHRVVGLESLFDVVLAAQRVTDYREFIAADKAKGDRFNASLRSNGILKAPGKLTCQPPYPKMISTKSRARLIQQQVPCKSAFSAGGRSSNMQLEFPVTWFWPGPGLQTVHERVSKGTEWYRTLGRCVSNAATWLPADAAD